jgi:hypothetical protein
LLKFDFSNGKLNSVILTRDNLNAKIQLIDTVK